WVEDVPAGLIKAIGALEILAAIGLILPPALGIFPVLAPLAAAGLVAVMVGAIITHARRGEYSSVVVNVVLAAMAIFVAWGRFGPYRF
ncbi:MAG: DoxX family protein, partial [Mycobacterium sp.]|uniref:DoxX family protein n=1 Tax=Mycobacterium sp. TaxID=1785 RepID=UPI003F96AC88